VYYRYSLAVVLHAHRCSCGWRLGVRESPREGGGQLRGGAPNASVDLGGREEGCAYKTKGRHHLPGIVLRHARKKDLTLTTAGHHLAKY